MSLRPSLRGARLVVDARAYDGADLQRRYFRKTYPLLRKQERQSFARDGNLSYLDLVQSHRPRKN